MDITVLAHIIVVMGHILSYDSSSYKNVHHALIKEYFLITLSYQFKDKKNLQILIYMS